VLIIVRGARLSGKTTVIAEVAKKMTYEYLIKSKAGKPLAELYYSADRRVCVPVVQGADNKRWLVRRALEHDYDVLLESTSTLSGDLSLRALSNSTRFITLSTTANECKRRAPKVARPPTDVTIVTSHTTARIDHDSLKKMKVDCKMMKAADAVEYILKELR